MMSLSAGQRRIWFLQTRDPEDTSLNSCAVFRLTGPLDTERLRASVADVVARHEILRSTYSLDRDDEPRRVLRPTAAPAWEQADLRELPEVGRERRVQVLIRREAGRPFDLTVETPLRCLVIRTGATEYTLALVAHAIGWDEQSWAPFCAEVGARYNGAELPTVAAAVSCESGSAADLDYWRELLQPVPQPLELPGRIAPPVTATLRTARSTAAIPTETARRVDEFAQAREIPTFAVLLAAYSALLHRYTAAADFLVCVPATLRAPAHEQALGYFGNTLLLRCAVDPAADFETCVRAVQAGAAAGFEHRGAGIDQVVAELNPDRSGGRDGLELLARTEFGLRDAAGFGLDGVTAEQLELSNPTTRMPLSLSVVTDSDRQYAEMTYQADEFDPRIVEQFLGHYLRILDAAITAPELAVGELDIFGSRDRESVLALSHGELADFAPTTLVESFERRVRADPGAIAVIAPDLALELSYGELNRRSNRLAHQLIRQGFGPEDVIALRMGTAVEFVVGVLAVLKCGAAYLPVDPAYPEDRAQFLIADAAPVAVFGPTRLRAAEEAAAALPDTDPTDADRVRPLRPAHLAYVIYTSGSTGQPKGVPVSHAAIAEHLDGFGAQWDMTAQDRLLQSSSVGFDASLLDVFVTLTLGAALVVPKADAFDDVAYVAEVISRCGVTVLHMVPSLLSTLLLLPEVHRWRDLRHVPVGGEALYGEVADRFAGIFDAELRNHYGPTEAVVSSTHMTVEGPQGTRIVPIGYPNRNVFLYLLDERMQLVPTGVVGEIYLGGNQLARGYLHRPGASAERFVADPFTVGGRLYRTGDLARRNGDGELEFLGRADEQVQVRGYRIELAEVQAAVVAHPDVAGCVVTAVQDETRGTMLAAYLVPAPGAVVDTDAVRGYAATVLPRYMVPAAFAIIDEIPLTEHGKLDRSALPAPEPAGAELFREPDTAVEARIAEMFGQMLGREPIGADDSFFDLGGHSLLATRLLSWVRSEFGVRVGVRELFDNPTVAALAARVEVLAMHETPVETY